jgi:predicted enzyme related to lactoylglutathione lyase
MAFFQCGHVRLLLGVAENTEQDRPASIIYYRVEDIAASHAALTSLGVEFVADPHLVHKTESQELWLAFFKDTEGNTLALMSERAA